MDFYEKLQKLRKEKTMTQEELAERLDVSRQAVSKWESDRTMPETDKIIQIANLFGVSLDYLLKDEEQKNNHKNFGSLKPKKHSGRYITGTVFLSLGFIGILAYFIVYNLTKENGIYTRFSSFLNANEALFIICCLLCFIGLLLISANVITRIFRAYIRQKRIFKYGVVLSVLGVVMSYISLILLINQSVVSINTYKIIDILTGETTETISETVRQSSLIPTVLLGFSVAVTVCGLVMLSVSIVKKVKDK